ncbi:unnamed protein product [Paramecium sonneborni]|uniref:Uncharacterized protein n=1 Tax=Paramecium sonneborni TaxID=65129 RepID=A0A8S1QXI4_9CILI|nr:unnamed protein product [Paramecium sonneborni]
MFQFRTIYKFASKTVDTEALLKKLQTKSLITLTRDNYQLNMGLMIQRDIIFLHYTEEEMKLRKFRYQLEKRNNYITKLPKELHEYTHYTGDQNVFGDETPSHVRLVGDVRSVFLENSKFFRHCDPNEMNNKLIQYNSLHTVYLLVKQNGIWTFPNINIEDKETFKETQTKLFEKMTQNTWQVYYYNRVPRLVTVDSNSDENAKIKGIKTIYFQAKHLQGKVQIFGYDDWAWVSRLEMNKYLTEQAYNKVIHALDL